MISSTRTILLLASIAVACPALSHPHKVGVEVWVHGSDIETPKHTATKTLRDSLETAVGRTPDMQLSAANAGSVRVTIPEDVIIAREGDAAYILFEANINVTKPTYATEVSGYCRQDALDSCAGKVVAAIRAAMFGRAR